MLTKHIESETNDERIELVKNRIEELYFKKADKAVNDIDAIKMNEDYLQKYPNGLYVRDAKTKIKELSFTIAARANTKEAYYDFIRKFPQSKYKQKALEGIEVLAFKDAENTNTIQAYESFVKEHPDSHFN